MAIRFADEPNKRTRVQKAPAVRAAGVNAGVNAKPAGDRHAPGSMAEYMRERRPKRSAIWKAGRWQVA
jgi:hypothetical protein